LRAPYSLRPSSTKEFDLNVIFVNTLKKMDFDFKRLTKYDKPFIGIVPCKAA
jgi:hypothetical protein